MPSNATRFVPAYRFTLPADVTAFIDTHLLMLEDSTLAARPHQTDSYPPMQCRWALKLLGPSRQVFDDMEDPYLRSRKDDVDHVVHRIQRICWLMGTSGADMTSSRLEAHCGGRG
ncbi:MAG: hypothetical protein R3F37_13090 [Candidatus Competibacteraceae bacterium]